MVQVDAIGNHTVRLVVADDAGNAAEVNTTFAVRDSRPPVISDLRLNTTDAAPVTLTLDGGAASDNVAVKTWKWRVVGPGTDYNLTGQTPNATFPAPGVYNITLTAEDAEGNRATHTFSVTIPAAPAPPNEVGLPLLLLVGLAAASGVIVASLLLRPPRKGKAQANEPGAPDKDARAESDPGEE
jgi:hypothetical protein